MKRNKDLPIFDFFTILMLFTYLFLNVIQFTEGGVAYRVLLILVSIITIRVVLLLFSNNIFFRNSILVLLLFLALILYNALHKTGIIEVLSEFLYGTTGGILFAYILGVISYIAIKGFFADNYEKHKYLSILCFYNSIIMIIVLSFSIYTLNVHVNNLREDIFLVQLNNAVYQRPGNFISMIFIICSFFITTTYSQLVESTGNRPKIAGFLFYISILTYIGNAIVLMLLAQMIGSNSGFVVVLLICLMTLSFILTMASRRTRERVGAVRLRFQSFLVGGIGRRLARNSVFMIIALGFGLAVTLHAAGVDFATMRIMNFGQGGDVVPSSVSGRLKVAENFTEQWAYAPVLGNLRADELTTGRGSYAHSLPLSLLSHTGLVGFTIFAVFFVSLLREMRNSARDAQGGDWFTHSKALNTYRILLLLVMTALASVATFFTWMPFWFTVGLVSQHVIFRPRLTRRSTPARQGDGRGAVPDATQQ